MSEIVVKTSIWKSVFFLVICLAFVGTGSLICIYARDYKQFGIGAICVLFFGLGSIVLIRQAADRRPRIIIDDFGITDRTLGIGRIDWHDIESSSLESMMTNSFIALQICDIEKYKSRLSETSKKLTRLNKTLGFEELNLNLSLTDAKPRHLQEIIAQRIAENGLHGVSANYFELPKR